MTADIVRTDCVVGDTGPLLCAGAAGREQGTSILYHRLKGRFLVPEAVRVELANQARRRDGVGRAARKVSGRHAFYSVDKRGFPPVDRQMVLAEIVAAEIAHARDREPKLGGHDGETHGILLAEAKNAIFLSNDYSALDVARSRGLRVATFADVLAAEIREGALLAEDAAQTCTRLHELEIHPGTRSLTALGITQRRPVVGL